MKRMMVFLTAVMMLLTMSACGSKETAREEVAVQKPESVVSDTAEVGEEEDVVGEGSEDSEEVSTEIIEEENSSANPVIPMSDNLEDFTVSIDGVVYQFPCSMEVFLNDGWLPSGYETKEEAMADERTIEPDDRCNPILYKNDLSMKMYVLQENTTGSTINWLEGTVIGFWQESGSELEMTISGDLVLNQDLTMDKVIEALGEPDKKTDTTCSYFCGGHYEFDFNYCNSGNVHWRIEKGGY